MRRRWAAAVTVIGLGLTSSCGLGETPLQSAHDACAEDFESTDGAADGSVYDADDLMTLDDDGESLTVRTPPGSTSNYITVRTVGCILERTDAPGALLDKMTSTTAEMGRQDDDWDDLEVEWSYSGSSSTFVAYFETAD